MSPEIPLQVITTADVRASVRRAKSSLEKAASEIVWQVEREAWRTLGYPSWDAMREAEYGDAAFMVPRKQRPELVQRMRAKGLTQQEIANTAGVSQRTISDDLNSNSANEPVPSITNARGQERPASYERTPEPPKQRRHPLPDSYWRAVFKLEKAVESVQRLHADDRFLANRDGLRDPNRRILERAAEILSRCESDLSGNNTCRQCGERMLPDATFEVECAACRQAV